MSYSSNPYLPNVRRQAVTLVFGGQSVALVAKQFGVHRTTVWRWCRLPGAHDARVKLANRSCRPHSHARQLSQAVVGRIVELWHMWRRCAQYIWHLLQREGVDVSVASVSRVLMRHHLSSRWCGQKGKEHRRRMPRPRIEAPGSFLQLDTIHFTNWRHQNKTRYFVYTLIDLKSRWAYAEYSQRISPEYSVAFVARAQAAAPFAFQLIQTDNGQEFSTAFEQRLKADNITQRRIRLGRKNDNAHIERFNRTIQDECLGRWPAPQSISEKLKEYLEFYNTKRLHLSLQGRTPNEVLQRF